MLAGSLRLDLRRYDEAVEALDVAQRSKGTWQSTPALRALAGRHDEALEFLRRARRAGFADPIVATVPELRPLHGNPEFEAIREEVEAVVRDARG